MRFPQPSHYESRRVDGIAVVQLRGPVRRSVAARRRWPIRRPDRVCPQRPAEPRVQPVQIGCTEPEPVNQSEPAQPSSVSPSAESGQPESVGPVAASSPSPSRTGRSRPRPHRRCVRAGADVRTTAFVGIAAELSAPRSDLSQPRAVFVVRGGTFERRRHRKPDWRRGIAQPDGREQSPDLGAKHERAAIHGGSHGGPATRDAVAVEPAVGRAPRPLRARREA
jgi:hypothetical protein